MPKSLSERAIRAIHHRWSGAASFPAAFSSPSYVRRGMGRRPPPLSLVRRALHRNLLFLLHRDLRERFVRRPVSVTSFGEKWEADLGDFGKKVTGLLLEQEKKRGFATISRQRQGERARVFLVCVDAFTRQVFARGMDNKSGASVTAAFRDIVNGLDPRRQPPPRHLETDAGKEFVNREFRAFCQQRGIRFSLAAGAHKARVAERAVRSMKRIIMAAVQSGSWKSGDSWDRLVRQAAKNMNGRYNRDLGCSPNQVRQKVWREITRSLARRNYVTLSKFMAREKTIRAGGIFREGGKAFRLGGDVLVPIQKRARGKVKDKEFVMHYDPLPQRVVGIFHAERPALFKIKNPRTGVMAKRFYYARELQPVELPAGMDSAQIEDWRVLPDNGGFQYRIRGSGWTAADL